MGHGAGDFFRIEVERDFDLDVTDIGGAIARPFRLDVLRLKRAASTREGDRERLVVAQLHCQLIQKSRLMHAGDVTNRDARAQSRNAGAARPAPAAGVTPALSKTRNAEDGISREGLPCGHSSISRFASFVMGQFFRSLFLCRYRS